VIVCEIKRIKEPYPVEINEIGESAEDEICYTMLSGQAYRQGKEASAH
jgi:hypothetical protein